MDIIPPGVEQVQAVDMIYRIEAQRDWDWCKRQSSPLWQQLSKGYFLDKNSTPFCVEGQRVVRRICIWVHVMFLWYNLSQTTEHGSPPPDVKLLRTWTFVLFWTAILEGERPLWIHFFRWRNWGFVGKEAVKQIWQCNCVLVREGFTKGRSSLSLLREAMIKIKTVFKNKEISPKGHRPMSLLLWIYTLFASRALG